jgi:hypothetical protein
VPVVCQIVDMILKGKLPYKEFITFAFDLIHINWLKTEDDLPQHEMDLL